MTATPFTWSARPAWSRAEKRANRETDPSPRRILLLAAAGRRVPWRAVMRAAPGTPRRPRQARRLRRHPAGGLSGRADRRPLRGSRSAGRSRAKIRTSSSPRRGRRWPWRRPAFFQDRHAVRDRLVELLARGTPRHGRRYGGRHRQAWLCRRVPASRPSTGGQPAKTEQNGRRARSARLALAAEAEDHGGQRRRGPGPGRSRTRRQISAATWPHRLPNSTALDSGCGASSSPSAGRRSTCFTRPSATLPSLRPAAEVGGDRGQVAHAAAALAP